MEPAPHAVVAQCTVHPVIHLKGYHSTFKITVYAQMDSQWLQAIIQQEQVRLCTPVSRTQRQIQTPALTQIPTQLVVVVVISLHAQSHQR